MGTTYNWNNAAGGAFDAQGNWTPIGVPGTADTAIFDLGNISYVVSGDGTPGYLVVDSDSVSFDGSIQAVGLSGQFTALEIGGAGAAYFVGAVLYAQYEVMVGDSNGDGTLQFIDGAVGTLTATNTATALDIGYYGLGDGGGGAPSTGDVLVDDSTLTILGGGYVGVFSDGSLTITDGAFVQFISSDAGYNSIEVAVNDPSVTGVITVDGGATLDVGIQTNIGLNGFGLLAISGGASVTLDGLYVADNGFIDAGDAPNTGLVTVDGGATTLTIEGVVVIGLEGNGTLAVTNNAYVQILPTPGAIDELDIGVATESTGTIIVTSGATFDVDEFTVIGDAGTGTLSFSDGATGTLVGQSYDNTANTYDESFSVYLGGHGGQGTLSIDGSTTSVTADEGLLVGQYGQGLVSLSNGATLAINLGTAGVGDYYSEIGSSSGSSGTLDVSGGAQLTGNSALFVGSTGDGTIAITSGGTVYSDSGTGNVDAALGYHAGGVGIGLIDDGLWFSNQSFSVGYQGSGTLTVQDGGVLQVDGSFLRISRDPGATGTLTINDSYVYAQIAELTVGPAATNTGDGPGGSGTLEIENYGDVYIGSAEVGGLAGGSGSIDVTGYSGLNITGNLSTGAGTSVITAEADGYVGVSGGVTIGGGGGAALVQLTSYGGLYAYDAGITIGTLGTIAFDASAYLVPDGGPLALDGGTLDALASRTFTYSVDVTGGTASAPSAIIGAPGAVLTIAAGITFVTSSVTVDNVPTIVPDVLLLGAAFNNTTTIDSFAAGDTLDIAGQIYNTASYNVVAQQLTLTEGPDPLALNIADNGYGADSFSAYTDGNGGTDVSLGPPPCYLAGTRIATPDGERRVEDLRPGDHVTLAAGGDAPLIWIGERRLDPTAHPRAWEVLPVRIRRDALDTGLPRRDLLVSPDHALLLDGVLVEAKRLVNGRTIVQETGWTSVHYLHLELARHDILLAEGVAAESYLDTGNRRAFADADAPLLHPSFAAPRAAASCAPFATDPDVVRPIWQRLDWRAVGLGHAADKLAATADPAARLRINGRLIAPLHAEQGRLCFALPPGARRLRLVSRAAAPTWSQPWLDDRRTLGLDVARIRLRGKGAVTDLPLDGPHLAEGWWDLEPKSNATHRWTNGDAAITLPFAADTLELTASALDAYPLSETNGRPAQKIATLAGGG